MNPSLAAGVLKCRAGPRFALYSTAPDVMSSAYSNPAAASMAHTAPAAMIGEAVRGAARHATLIDVCVTDRATSPSEHGTHTVGPSHAVPPHAPAHTARLAIWPPTPPSWSA